MKEKVIWRLEFLILVSKERNNNNNKIYIEGWGGNMGRNNCLEFLRMRERYMNLDWED